jgi:hypothetical protein
MGVNASTQTIDETSFEATYAYGR